jgi:hypothetical protein
MPVTDLLHVDLAVVDEIENADKFAKLKKKSRKSTFAIGSVFAEQA